MAERKLNEEQMRRYIENEVRKALMEERQGRSLLSESISEVLDENMTDEGFLDWIQNLLGGGQGNGRGISMEGIIGGILGRFFAPVLGKLLEKIGIRADGEIGKLILNAASSVGGYALGQWVDKKWDPIGIDNNRNGGRGFLGLGGGSTGNDKN